MFRLKFLDKRRLEKVLEMSYKIIKFINLKKDLHETLIFILKEISKVIEYKYGAIMLLDNNKLKVIASKNYDETTRSLEYKLGEGLVGYSAMTGLKIYTPDLRKEKWTRVKPKFEKLGIYKNIKSVLILPLKVENKVLGILEIISKKKNAFKKEEKTTLNMIARNIALAIENIHLEEQAKNHMIDLIQTIYLAFENKDPYLKGHSERVAKYSREIAKAFGFEEKMQASIYRAACLHDIGKLNIARNLLLSKKRFTQKDNPIKKHTLEGYKIISGYSFKDKNIILDAIRSHHEYFNGKGYPDKLKGEEIPFVARIVSVADAYDAMRSNRPYRKAFSKRIAIQRLKKDKNKQFDPIILDTFIKILEKKQQKETAIRLKKK